MMITANEIIEQLGLMPLPIEGGYYNINYCSDDEIIEAGLPERYPANRTLSGTVYFLETEEQFSAMHILPTDEIYYHHIGDPIEMLFLYPNGKGEIHILGSDITTGQRPQIFAPRDCWHGSRPLLGGEYGFSLGSTSMAPGYDQGDSILAARNKLTNKYPKSSTLIESLTHLVPHNV